jgi:hypothetical protein
VLSIGLGIAPNEYVYEASGPFGVLPYFVSQGARLILADIRHTLVYRRKALIERLWLHLITGDLVYLVCVSLDVSHLNPPRVIATK